MDLRTMALLTKQAASNAGGQYKVADHVTPEHVQAGKDAEARFAANKLKMDNATRASQRSGQAASSSARSRQELGASVKGIPGRLASAGRDAGSYLKGLPGRAGVAGREAGTYLSENKGKAGLIAAGLATVGAGAGYAYNQQKTASEAICEQRDVAEEIYADALDKIAYAEDLYEDAYYAEKIAAGVTPEMVEAEKANKARLAAANARGNAQNLASAGRGASQSARTQAKTELMSKVKGAPGQFSAGVNNAVNSTRDAAVRAGAYLKANKGKAGLAGAGIAALAGGAYAYNQQKEASYFNELGTAKEAAEMLYADCVEKMAFAEQLFGEADYEEKVAADNGAGEPVSWIDQVRTPAGATMTATGAGIGAITGAMMSQGRGSYARAGAGVAGGLLGAGVAAGSMGALTAFFEQQRQARAQAEQAEHGL